VGWSGPGAWVSRLGFVMDEALPGGLETVFEGLSFFQACPSGWGLSETDRGAQGVREVFLRAPWSPSLAPPGQDRVEVFKSIAPGTRPGPSCPCNTDPVLPRPDLGQDRARSSGGGSQAEAGLLITVQLY